MAISEVRELRPLMAEEARRMDAYWRAANYLSVGQIYLYDNPLLREPLKLDHVKPPLLGHWGLSAANVMVWAKRWLVAEAPKLGRYGLQRMVRDVLTVSRFVELGKTGAVKRVVLNGASALARACAKALLVLLEAEHVHVTLGET